MSMATNSLLGKRILVTRAKEQAKSFSEKIKACGGVPIEVPLIAIHPPNNEEIIKEELSKLHTFDWIVFTSVNGVKFFFSFLERYNYSWEQLNRPQIAVVGKKTLFALEKKGICANLVPNDFVAESLFDEMKIVVKNEERVLLARGNLARSSLPESLTKLGVSVVDLIVYETGINKQAKLELIELIKNKELDVITFTSSSTVSHFVELVEGIDWHTYIKGLTVACIGPIAADTARALGIQPTIIPDEYTIDGMIDAMIKYYR